MSPHSSSPEPTESGADNTVASDPQVSPTAPRSRRRVALAALLVTVLGLAAVVTWWSMAGGESAIPGVVAADRQARLYEWRRVDRTPLADLAPVLTQWHERGGQTVVIDVTLFAPAATDNATSQTRAQLATYVAAAREVGLQVEALAGDPTLIAAPEEMRAINESLKAYNIAYPELRVRSIVWDVEPWQEQNWDQTAYLDFVETVVNSTPKGVVCGFAVPSWFAHSHTQSVTWRGRDASMAKHLAGLVAGADGSFLAVMDYFDTVAEARVGMTPWIELGVPVRSVFEIGDSAPGTSLQGQTWEEQAAFLNEVSEPWVGLPYYDGVDVDSAGFLPPWSPPGAVVDGG